MELHELITFIFKMIIVYILIIPAVILSWIIWICGGWTKGWDDMPNPAYALISLLD